MYTDYLSEEDEELNEFLKSKISLPGYTYGDLLFEVYRYIVLTVKNFFGFGFV